jgi:hypothetical protein
MDEIEFLRKLIDEDAITFLKDNEKEIDAQFKCFLEINNLENVYVNYTQNNFKEEIGNVPACPDSM